MTPVSVLENGRATAANGLKIRVQQIGNGPDVLLLGGLGDTVESWQFQLDVLPRHLHRAGAPPGSGRGGHRGRAAVPVPAVAGGLQRFLGAFMHHDSTARLPDIAVPTLVLDGGRDSTTRPEVCQRVAALIPGARFEVMPDEAHQPFQEVSEEWNARVASCWREVE